ncbi:efflux RND transporter periplasmic adaptor subunit [Dyella sp.]|uniref:efflux RND transporter periplasmic adaptor subunit n=1 Tax=Dyella sp. TaxID=1869338 RepID=UPI002ED42128
MNRCTFTGVICLLLVACHAPDDAPSVSPQAQVHTVPVAMGDLVLKEDIYGVAQVNVAQVQSVTTQASGVIAQWEVVPGMQVRRGAPLLTIAVTPAARAAWRQARSAVAAARVDRDHVAALLARQLATRDQLSHADKALDDAQTTWDALREQQGDASRLVVKAPCDGVIDALRVARGDNVSPGTSLLSMSPSDQQVVHAGAEAYSRIQQGDVVSLVAFDGAASMHGKVRYIARALDTRTHQLDVDIAADQPLLVGQGYRARIEVATQHGWIVPDQALVGEASDRHVFQLAAGKAVAVPVTILAEQDGLSAVKANLDAARPLVTMGATQLQDGMAASESAR